MMSPYAEPHDVLAVPDGFHAFLHADVRVQFPEVGSSVYLTLRGGKIIRATASAHLLHHRFQFHGRHLATLRLQTDPFGRPKEPLFLAGLSPLKKSVEVTSRVWWSAAGLVAAHPDEVIVFGSASRSVPHRICYRRPSACTNLAERGQSVRVEGVVSGGRLTATAIHILPPLVVPRRWAQWRWL